MIKIENLVINYKSRQILEESAFDIPEGKITMLLGVSGSGKTTLLYRLGLINQSRDFRYLIDGQDLNHLSEKKRQNFIATNIGYVLQTKGLIEHSVYSNLVYAYQLINQKVTKEQIIEDLKKVNLENEINHRVDQLSEGQKQRLAILCAIVKKPRILILDEPTSALDRKNGIQIFELLRQLANEGCTVIFTCHQLFAREYADTIYMIEDHKLVQEKICDDNEIINKKQYNKRLNSVFYYLQSFIKRYTRRFAMIILTISIIIAGFSFSINYHDTIISQSVIRSGIYNDSQIYVKFENNQEMIDKLNQDPFIHKAYPFYSLSGKVSIDGEVEEFDIYPTFDDNDYSNYYETNKNVLSKEGNYLSDELFTNLMNIGYCRNYMLVYVEGCDINQYVKIAYNGSYNKRMVNYYHQDHMNFMNMYYKDINQMIKDHNGTLEPSGVIVFLKDIQYLDQFKKQYSYIDLIESYHYIGVLDLLKDALQEYRSNMITVVFSFVLLIMTMLEIGYLKVRKEEFAIMLINGVENKSLRFILWIENLIQILISTIIGSIFFAIIYLSCAHYEIIVDSINIQNMVKLILLLALLIYIILIVITFVYIQLVNPEKVLRD